MKKKIYLACTIACLIALGTSIKFLNQITYSKIINYSQFYQDNGYNFSMMKIDNHMYVENISAQDFHSTLNDLAIKNDVIIVKFDMSLSFNNRENITKLYVSSNDKYGEKIILLQNGLFDKIDEYHNYSSKTHNSKRRIALYDNRTEVEVSSIINDENNSGNYILLSQSPNSESIKSFTNQLIQKYNQLNINAYDKKDVTIEQHDKSVVKNLNENLIFEIIIGLLLGAISFISIFRFNKYIAICKTEGISDFKIFKKIIIENLIAAFF
ncbi:MAG: hypothetical protein ACK5L6_03185 [Anaerorhabdus sp.]|uniref:hypothetical protein n=1 Tax=Anaerorhabdus sp. TaxID=1872524 RepID=UPI003A8B92D4